MNAIVKTHTNDHLKQVVIDAVQELVEIDKFKLSAFDGSVRNSWGGLSLNNIWYRLVIEDATLAVRWLKPMTEHMIKPTIYERFLPSMDKDELVSVIREHYKGILNTVYRLIYDDIRKPLFEFGINEAKSPFKFDDLMYDYISNHIMDTHGPCAWYHIHWYQYGEINAYPICAVNVENNGIEKRYTLMERHKARWIL